MTLGRLDARTYVDSFRSINAVILNGWFLTPFFLAPVAAVLAVILGGGTYHAAWGWVVAGAVCAVLTWVITMVANAPLNQGLAMAPTLTDQDFEAARQTFEAAWNRWNLVRTVTGIGAMGLLAVAG